MPTLVSTGQITIVDVNDGSNAYLTNNSAVLPADAAGTVSSYTGAETFFKVVEANVDTTTNWSFYVSATGGGVAYRDSDDAADRTGTGASGYLGGTNLVSYSDYNAATWVNNFPAGASITTGIADPFGGTAAVRLTCNGTTNALLRITIPSFTPNGTTAYTLSFYCRRVSGTGTASCDLNDGAPSTSNYATQLVTGSYVRVQITGTPTATAKALVDLFGDNTTTQVLDFAGVQLEPTTTASELTRTIGTAASGTRGYLKITSLTQDLSYLDITASKIGGQSFTQRYSVARAKTGVTGTRGTITTSAATAGVVWSDAEANTAISTAGGGSPLAGDVVTLYNSAASFSQTRVRTSGGLWAALAAFFGGDVLVDGTLGAVKLAANSVTAGKIAAGAITTSKLLVAPASLCPSPYFEDTAWWTATLYDATGWYFESGTSFTGTSTQAALWSAHPTNIPGTARKHLWSGNVAAPAVGTVVRLRARVRNDSNQVIYVAARFYTAAGANISDLNLVSAASSGQQDLTAQLVVPSNSAFIRFIVYNEGVTTYSGAAAVSAVMLNTAAGADLIVDGAITAAKIAANTITAGQIAANTITASKLLLADLSNIAPDADMADSNAWSAPTAWETPPSASWRGSRVARLDAAASAYKVLEGKVFPVEAGAALHFSFQGQVLAGAGTFVGRLQLSAATDMSTPTYLGSTSSVSTTLVTSAGNFTVPAGMKYARVQLFKNNDAATSVRVGGVVVRRAANAEMIVDGSISAAKISAGAITTDKLLVTGRGKALNDDPTFQDAAAWSQGGGSGSFALVTEPTSPVGTKVLRATNEVQFRARSFPITAGTRYKVTMWAQQTSGTGTMYLRLYCYNAAGTLINYVATTVSPGSGTLEGIDVPATWTKYIGYVDAGAATVTGQLIVHVNWGGGGGVTDVADCRVEEYIGADLIVDGAITAGKLAAGSIAVGTAAITDGAIVNAMIGDLTADKITSSYTTSVDLEAATFFGSEFYIGGTATYEYNFAGRPTVKSGIASIASPNIALKSTGAEFNVGYFKIKNGAGATAVDVFEVSGGNVRIKQGYFQGLAVTDAIGNIILASGSPLASSNITAAAGWLNSNISVDATGNLVGVGGNYTRLGKNLLDAGKWVFGSSGAQTGFSPNTVSSGGSNSIIYEVLPDGSRGILWRAISGSATTANGEGGWNTTTIYIDHTKMYRFSVWIRCSAGATGNNYLGPGESTVNDIGGTVNSNPYFHSGTRAGQTQGVWHLFVGFVLPSTYSGAQQSMSGIYSALSGQLVGSGADFRWVSGQTTTWHRAYQYYTTAAGTTQDFFDPRVELCDGTEPSLGALLAMGSPSARNPITSSNVSTYIASAAIGSAQIGSLAAANISVGTLSNVINNSATSGERVVINSNQILVYDAAGNIRVKLGNLA